MLLAITMTDDSDRIKYKRAKIIKENTKIKIKKRKKKKKNVKINQ
jgi:hypothetical protein